MNRNISPQERKVIEIINHPLYSGEYVDSCFNMKVSTIFENESNMTKDASVKGFMEAVRGILKKGVLFEIVLADDETRERLIHEPIHEDIRSRLELLSEEQLNGRKLEELAEDQEFLADVQFQWDQILGYCEGYWDTYWETCTQAIKIVIEETETEKLP